MTHSQGANDHVDHGAHERLRRERGDATSSRPVQGAFAAGEARQARRLGMVLALVGTFFVVEVVGAIVAQSVVLQADALHLLMDVLALGVSLLAMRLAIVRPTPRFTFGLRRAEPVAAIFSALLVLATTVGIVAEGVEALHDPTPPRAGVMLIVACAALVVSGLSAGLLHDAIRHGHSHAPAADGLDHASATLPQSPKAHGHALNLRGAWLHLLGDTLGAVAALCAALIIRFGGNPAADPIASFVVAAILLFGSLNLLRDATLVLLEAAPPHLPVVDVGRIVAGFPGVAAVQELHVWSLGAGHDAVTVHVRSDSRDPELGKRLSDRIRTGLGVEYVTVQVEAGEQPRAELRGPSTSKP
jgi:cobalt-zinc-cadmium efflux system protein